MQNLPTPTREPEDHFPWCLPERCDAVTHRSQRFDIASASITVSLVYFSPERGAMVDIDMIGPLTLDEAAQLNAALTSLLMRAGQ